ncbi:MAG: hypothetical protein D3906_10445, partial [Candidatus Electrothrix sp. AUS1_2]|nr:hypothetical protein [Candidatus Electrothrix sp. AUS1_2]
MHDDMFTKGARGEFRGDFSRDTFDPMRHFSRVLMQQGRVQLDADWNEQVSILLHYMRQLGRDLMGPHGAPYPDDDVTKEDLEKLFENFKIKPSKSNPPNFFIAHGRYYVNGICCENSNDINFRDQEGFPFSPEEPELSEGTYLVYLDVWERHLTYVEDDYMREKALGGADTAARSQIVWQVKAMAKSSLANWEKFQGANYSYQCFLDVLADQTSPGTGQLKARAKKTSGDDNDPCRTAPEASYRGAENQLYRVEIHNSNKDGSTATFKWSRENGSVIFPITNIGTDQITLEHLGRDDRFGLQPGDWVEVLDDDVILRNKANPLLKVTAVDKESLQVTLEGTPASNVGKDLAKHPYLRRWDQKKGVNKYGVIPVTAGNGENDWILLEDGVEVQLFKIFKERIDAVRGELAVAERKAESVAGAMKKALDDLGGGAGLDVKERKSKFVAAVFGAKLDVAAIKMKMEAVYQTGDYWLIPARTATKDVEWPQDE